MKAVRLSALRTGRPHPQEIFWYSFLSEVEAEAVDYVNKNFQ